MFWCACRERVAYSVWSGGFYLCTIVLTHRLLKSLSAPRCYSPKLFFSPKPFCPSSVWFLLFASSDMWVRLVKTSKVPFSRNPILLLLSLCSVGASCQRPQHFLPLDLSALVGRSSQPMRSRAAHAWPASRAAGPRGVEQCTRSQRDGSHSTHGQH